MRTYAKFVDLLVVDRSLYALDDEGHVWNYDFEAEVWSELPNNRRPFIESQYEGEVP